MTQIYSGNSFLIFINFGTIGEKKNWNFEYKSRKHQLNRHIVRIFIRLNIWCVSVVEKMDWWFCRCLRPCSGWTSYIFFILLPNHIQICMQLFYELSKVIGYFVHPRPVELLFLCAVLCYRYGWWVWMTPQTHSPNHFSIYCGRLQEGLAYSLSHTYTHKVCGGKQQQNHKTRIIAIHSSSNSSRSVDPKQNGAARKNTHRVYVHVLCRFRGMF